MEQNISKAMESMRTISKTVANLSEASQNLGQSINNLAYDNSLAEKIQVDIDYIKWISGFITERAKCVLDNTCGRKGLNQLPEDELSAKLNYDFFCKKNASNKHIRKLAAAIHQAEANGEDGVEWMLKNTNIEEVITGKVQRPWVPEPAGIGKILREWRGDRYSLYAIAKEQNCRAEGLQRIEEGKDVTTTNLMHYLHFIKAHDPQSDVIAAIWHVL